MWHTKLWNTPTPPPAPGARNNRDEKSKRNLHTPPMKYTIYRRNWHPSCINYCFIGIFQNFSPPIDELYDIWILPKMLKKLWPTQKNSILSSLVFVLCGFFKIMTYKIVTYTKISPPPGARPNRGRCYKFQGILPLRWVIWHLNTPKNAKKIMSHSKLWHTPKYSPLAPVLIGVRGCWACSDIG